MGSYIIPRTVHPSVVNPTERHSQPSWLYKSTPPGNSDHGRGSVYVLRGHNTPPPKRRCTLTQGCLFSTRRLYIPTVQSTRRFELRGGCTPLIKAPSFPRSSRLFPHANGEPSCATRCIRQSTKRLSKSSRCPCTSHVHQSASATAKEADYPARREDASFASNGALSGISLSSAFPIPGEEYSLPLKGCRLGASRDEIIVPRDRHFSCSKSALMDAILEKCFKGRELEEERESFIELCRLCEAQLHARILPLLEDLRADAHALETTSGDSEGGNSAADKIRPDDPAGERLERTLVSLLSRAQYTPIGAADMELADELASDSLLALPITVPRPLLPQGSVGSQGTPPASSIMLFRRGFSVETQKGRLLGAKFDYLQAVLLRGLLSLVLLPIQLGLEAVLATASVVGAATTSVYQEFSTETAEFLGSNSGAFTTKAAAVWQTIYSSLQRAEQEMREREAAIREDVAAALRRLLPTSLREEAEIGRAGETEATEEPTSSKGDPEHTGDCSGGTPQDVSLTVVDQSTLQRGTGPGATESPHSRQDGQPGAAQNHVERSEEQKTTGIGGAAEVKLPLLTRGSSAGQGGLNPRDPPFKELRWANGAGSARAGTSSVQTEAGVGTDRSESGSKADEQEPTDSPKGAPSSNKKIINQDPGQDPKYSESDVDWRAPLQPFYSANVKSTGSTEQEASRKDSAPPISNGGEREAPQEAMDTRDEIVEGGGVAKSGTTESAQGAEAEGEGEGAGEGAPSLTELLKATSRSLYRDALSPGGYRWALAQAVLSALRRPGRKGEPSARVQRQQAQAEYRKDFGEPGRVLRRVRMEDIWRRRAPEEDDEEDEAEDDGFGGEKGRGTGWGLEEAAGQAQALSQPVSPVDDWAYQEGANEGSEGEWHRSGLAIKWRRNDAERRRRAEESFVREWSEDEEPSTAPKDAPRQRTASDVQSVGRQGGPRGEKGPQGGWSQFSGTGRHASFTESLGQLLRTLLYGVPNSSATQEASRSRQGSAAYPEYFRSIWGKGNRGGVSSSPLRAQEDALSLEYARRAAMRLQMKAKWVMRRAYHGLSEGLRRFHFLRRRIWRRAAAAVAPITGAVKVFLSPVTLEDPAHDQLVVLGSRALVPPEAEAPPEKKGLRAQSLARWKQLLGVPPTKEHGEGAPPEKRGEQGRAVTLRVYQRIPLPGIKVVFPNKRLMFRPLDMLRLDLTTLIGLLAYVINYRFEDALSSPSAFALDVVAATALVLFISRTVLGYLNTWNRYQLLMNKELSAKTVAVSFPAILTLLDDCVQQQIMETLLSLAMLHVLQRTLRKDTVTAEELKTACEQFMVESLHIDMEMPIKQALHLLESLGAVRVLLSEGGASNHVGTCLSPSSMEVQSVPWKAVKQSWSSKTREQPAS